MGALLRNALAAAALGLPAACVGDWENSTTLRVYRVTPSDVEGLADMDSADSAGDLAFGLSQLLAPRRSASARASRTRAAGGSSTRRCAARWL
eukprot:COSAG04_NODE_9717_length_837_cov_1.300813_2_plen_93_part_00